MGRMTNLQVNSSLERFKENPTPENELVYLNWKKRQMKESGGFSYYSGSATVDNIPVGCCECYTRIGKSDLSKCLQIKSKYPQLIERIDLLEKQIKLKNEIKQKEKSIILAKVESSPSKEPEIINSENLSTVGASALPLLVVGLLLYSGKGMK